MAQTSILGTNRTLKRGNPAARSEALWGYLMIAPNTIGLIILHAIPVVLTVYYSFTEWGAFGDSAWAGLANYRRLIADTEFWGAVRNTVVYTLVVVPVSISLSIIVATLLNQKIRGVGIYRMLYFLPVITLPVAIAMTWKWLFNADYGLINYLLSLIGIHGPRWISDPKVALISVIMVGVWARIGYDMVVLLSGLKGISSTYYEAASIDGAGPMTQFFRITLPLLTPTIFFLSIMGLIGAFQVFELIFIMIGRDSLSIQSTESVSYLFYQKAFLHNEKGYGAAIVLFLFLVTLLLTMVQMKLQRRWVHYE